MIDYFHASVKQKLAIIAFFAIIFFNQIMFSPEMGFFKFLFYCSIRFCILPIYCYNCFRCCLEWYMAKFGLIVWSHYFQWKFGVFKRSIFNNWSICFHPHHFLSTSNSHICRRWRTVRIVRKCTLRFYYLSNTYWISRKIIHLLDIF